MFKTSLVLFLGASLSAATATAASFRISDAGPAGDPAYVAGLADAAFNRDLNQYLVAWLGTDDADGQQIEEYEVYIQLIDGETGEELLPEDRRISTMGGLGDADYDARLAVAVAYNPTDRNYLVAWTGDDTRDGQLDDENEVFVQLIDAVSGDSMFPDTQRVSDMYGVGSSYGDAADAAVAYNPVDNEFLVVWQGQDPPQLQPGDDEIFVQRIDGETGQEIGSDQRISELGGLGAESQRFAARRPHVAHDPEHNIYLVAWTAVQSGRDSRRLVVVQRLDGSTAAEIGEDDQVISALGATAAHQGDAAVAYNPDADEFLVVWRGTTQILISRSGEYEREDEIYSRRIDAVSGALLGRSELQVSEMGGPENPFYRAASPSVGYDVVVGQYLVVWSADDHRGGLVDDEREIFGRWISSRDGQSSDQFRITEVGGIGSGRYDARSPDLAIGADGKSLVVWTANEDSKTLHSREFEVYGDFVRGRARQVTRHDR